MQCKLVYFLDLLFRHSGGNVFISELFLLLVKFLSLVGKIDTHLVISFEFLKFGENQKLGDYGYLAA